MKLFILCLAAFIAGGECFAINNPKASACEFLVNSLPQPTPLLVNPGTATFFRASDASGTLGFNVGQSVLVACTGSTNYVTIKGSGTTEVVATCVSGTTFTVDGTSYDISQITCNRWPVAEDRASGSCLSGNTYIKIGYAISTGFLEAYDVCHDTSRHHTHFTKLILTSDSASFQSGVDRPDWINGNFFSGVNPTTLYTRATQRVTMTNLLGSAALAEKYISLTNDYFLSKGHMVAKADFFYGAQQHATFFYTNAAPQWQTVNGANWNSLENDARSLAGRIGADLTVYTGTHGIATLPNVNDVETDLYLGVSGTTRFMPVPRMFWKVLYNPSTQAGIAFVSLNNPYQTAASAAQDVLCTNICSQVSWLTWTASDLIKGYSYCCEVNDFRNAFPDLPYFDVNSILT